MSFLIDTNVVSEWTKPRPSPNVMRWLGAADEDRTFISVATLAELRYGVERLPASARRNRLAVWLEDELAERFESRVLNIDAEIADIWGRLVARRDAAGRRMDPMDAFIAATAQAASLSVVTRNEKDFEGLGLKLINPWTA